MLVFAVRKACLLPQIELSCDCSQASCSCYSNQRPKIRIIVQFCCVETRRLSLQIQIQVMDADINFIIKKHGIDFCKMLIINIKECLFVVVFLLFVFVVFSPKSK